ncbi:uncharacterized protein LOC135165380 [Diachasmimorpha longicaudata]|uniref:uncharacterized protein LOC135165380 n=1 Tax=Diachasmimorpha longicaudata TaxID=58733 RepID=UPI0030B893C0
MLRFKKMFALHIPPSIAPRDDKILRICCSSPSCVKYPRLQTDRVPRDSWRGSTTSLDIVKRLDAGKIVAAPRKQNFDMCKEPPALENPSGVDKKNHKPAGELKTSDKTYPEMIREYSEKIDSKIAQKKEKNSITGIFSKSTIEKISSLAGVKTKHGGSSSKNSSWKFPEKPMKKIDKYSNEKSSEVSIIIEPLPPDLNSHMSDMGIMMITVCEKIIPTRSFGAVDLRINGVPVTRVKQISTRFPTLNVTSSCGKCEIKIPIAMRNKSMLNLSLSGTSRSKPETDVPLKRMTGNSERLEESEMRKTVPWWTSLESFRILETPDNLKIELQVLKSPQPVANIPNNSGSSGEQSREKVNLSPAKPVKSSSISEMSHDKGVGLHKSDMKNINSLMNQWLNSKKKIPPNHRFPEARLRYAPVIKSSVSPIKNPKVQETRNTIPWTSAKLSSPTSYLKIPQNNSSKINAASGKPSDETSGGVSPIPELSVMPGENLELVEVTVAPGTMKSVKRGKGNSLIDNEHRVPTVKNPERKLKQLDQDNRMLTEASIEEVMSKKSGPRDASVDRIVKNRKNINDPAKPGDDRGITGGDTLPDDSGSPVGSQRMHSGHHQGRSSNGNNQVTLQGTKTSGESGYPATTVECNNTVRVKDENILTAPSTRSMGKLKMRLQRSMDRDTKRNADTSVKDRSSIQYPSHRNLNDNTTKKILYSAWLNNPQQKDD